MSYVGDPFHHDIFVTYSHGDVDGNGESYLKQWSQAFARELESELRALPRVGRDVSVFLDQHPRAGKGVDPMAPLTEQLRAEIARSAIMAALISPHYFESSWCRDERDWWDQSQVSSGISRAERVALARIWPVLPEPDWPELFVDSRGEPLTGFWFYDRTRAEDHPQPYEWPAAEKTSKGPFREELLRLVSSLRMKLDALKRQVDERRRREVEATRLAEDQGRVVYLHGRSDQEKPWIEANETLSKNGFAVVPNEPDPVERDPRKFQDLRRNRIQTLSGCDALLLLGSPDGSAVDADLVVIGRQDRHSARALSNRLLPCALLDTVGSAIATPRRKTSARALQVDWIDSTTPPWVPQLKRWLNEKSATLREST